MKRPFRIFELSKNEQRVVLIIMLVLIVIAFVAYERRVYSTSARSKPTTESIASPTPIETDDEQ